MNYKPYISIRKKVSANNLIFLEIKTIEFEEYWRHLDSVYLSTLKFNSWTGLLQSQAVTNLSAYENYLSCVKHEMKTR